MHIVQMIKGWFQENTFAKITSSLSKITDDLDRLIVQEKVKIDSSKQEVEAAKNHFQHLLSIEQVKQECCEVEINQAKTATSNLRQLLGVDALQES